MTAGRILTMVVLSFPAVAAAADAIDVGSGKQLFFDDRFIAESEDGLHWTKPSLGIVEVNFDDLTFTLREKE
ncbi:MAG TPA: hypothetical protein PLO37_22260 [Candidatus Hydrogenedentes bacterium]|nr:hypothetical protein [Candidatus Hydrogenedentota bacterium]HPG69581.1 hypothetical protein [Candidatus Hydrogenedentota bacterium]